MATEMPGERRRTMPLVPEPIIYGRSRQALYCKDPPFAKRLARFCPDLNDKEYVRRLRSLDKEKFDDFGQRVTTLQKHAIQNFVFHASEYAWEADAWSDVFGVFRDDTRDKRPYEFVHTDETGKRTVVKRTPDATIGLRSYNDADMEYGYHCSVDDCKEDHSPMQPLESLHEARIVGQMYQKDCGLIVDGRWGEAELLFPFAVYEAKKRPDSYEAAEEQVYEACALYLGMLDDLARDPHDVTRYQSDQSNSYQVFAFVSCGPIWQVFVAWNNIYGGTVETIWEGDVRNIGNAGKLTYIVTQVFDYAVNQHRRFVSAHLEPWILHGSKLLEASIAQELGDIWPSGDNADEETNDSLAKNSDKSRGKAKANTTMETERSPGLRESAVARIFEYLGSSGPDPEWLRLKKQTQSWRSEKAAGTRKRNARVEKRRAMDLHHDGNISVVLQGQTQSKRPRDEDNSAQVPQHPPKKRRADTRRKGNSLGREH